MGKRLGAVIGALLATAAIAAPSASAATEFGDNCIANEATNTAGATLFEFSAPANPLPLAAPSAGVITKWKSTLVPAPVLIPQTLKVVRLNTTAKSASVIAEDVRSITGGVNTFNVRIPVQAGDHIGLFGSSEEYGNLICETPEEVAVIGGFEGAAVGTSSPYIEVPAPLRIPVAAILEADADGDGFGDESQDLCPQSATTQAACPVVVLDAFAIAGKGSATVIVSSSTEAPITVSGTVALPKGKASSSAQAKLKKVTKKVKPGTFGKFKLKFPGSLKSALAALAPGKSLTLKITASAKNVAGAASKDKLKLKLK